MATSKVKASAKVKALLAHGWTFCGRCEGKGERYWDYKQATTPCYDCDGAGAVPPVDTAAIRLAVKGKGNTIVRASAPSKRRTLAERRAYYVWRMARFHGGADVTMPIVAGFTAGDDPLRADLDALAERLAREAYGTDMGAANAWGRALGMR